MVVSVCPATHNQSGSSWSPPPTSQARLGFPLFAAGHFVYGALECVKMRVTSTQGAGDRNQWARQVASIHRRKCVARIQVVRTGTHICTPNKTAYISRLWATGSRGCPGSRCLGRSGESLSKLSRMTRYDDEES